MNTLMYEMQEFCKDMSITNIVKYCWVNRYKQKHCSRDKEDIEKLNEWLELRIKEMIRFKIKTEKLLDSK